MNDGGAPRGVRNNNPGNIRRSPIKWRGMSSTQTDDAFVQFAEPIFGIRAAMILLINYQGVHGLDTVRELVDRWAPPVENDTGAYVADVCRELGCGPDDHIDVYDQASLIDLALAIFKHENGAPMLYPDELMSRAAKMALSKDRLAS